MAVKGTKFSFLSLLMFTASERTHIDTFNRENLQLPQGYNVQEVAALGSFANFSPESMTICTVRMAKDVISHSFRW